jgi:hypothetical protein
MTAEEVHRNKVEGRRLLRDVLATAERMESCINQQRFRAGLPPLNLVSEELRRRVTEPIDEEPAAAA